MSIDMTLQQWAMFIMGVYGENLCLLSDRAEMLFLVIYKQKNVDTHPESFSSKKQEIKMLSRKSLWQTYMKWTVQPFPTFWCQNLPISCLLENQIFHTNQENTFFFSCQYRMDMWRIKISPGQLPWLLREGTGDVVQREYDKNSGHEMKGSSTFQTVFRRCYSWFYFIDIDVDWRRQTMHSLYLYMYIHL